MKHPITIFLIMIASAAHAQNSFPHGSHDIIDSNYSKCEFDTVVYMPLYADPDSITSLAVDANGKLYNKVGGSGSGSINSVFGRTGVITAQIGDYSSYYEPLLNYTPISLPQFNDSLFIYLHIPDSITIFATQYGQDTTALNARAYTVTQLGNYYSKTVADARYAPININGTVTSITAGTGLNGGTITTSGTISLPNTGTSGTYGNSTQIPVITTDPQGRVTAITTASPAPGNLTGDVSSSGLTTSYNNLVPVSKGGLNKSAAVLYDIPYATSTTGYGAIGIGSASQVLSVNSGATGYIWSNPLSGTVTSVGLTAPSVFSVTPSSITTSGTFNLAFNGGQTANQFLATPNGSSGALGLRAIAATDLPSLAYLTSFSSGSLSPLFTTSVATATTTPALSYSLSAQTANNVFAGPSTGSATTPTFRSLVSTDIPSLTGAQVGISGLSATGTPSATTFLRGDNTWAVPVGSTYTATSPVTLAAGSFGFQTIPSTSVVANITGSTATPTGNIAYSAAGTSASTLKESDANANISANNTIEGWATTTSAAGTVTLTVASAAILVTTGTSTETYVLPVTSTLVQGQHYHFENNSTGTVTILSSGSNTVVTVYGNSVADVTCISTSGTTAASWSTEYAYPSTTTAIANTTVLRDGSGSTSVAGLTASTINGNTITSGTGILTLAAGKTLTANNTLTFSGTDGSTLNMGSGGTLGSNAYTSTAYAPLASPVLTGSPTAPTQTAGDNSTDIATDAFINTAITNNNSSYLPLVGGSMTGALNEAKGTNIASAATTNIGAATGNYVNVTGTTTITGLGTVQAGTRRFVNFNGVLTLTYNATSLILPGAANITTAAGDVATFTSLGSGNWICDNYQPAGMTGTGFGVLQTSPSLVTPNIGTPSAGTLTSCTGLPISTGVSGLGTGVATFLATPSAANLASAVTSTTGTAGSLVFSAGPTFTGAPAAPTAAVGTNTTQIATTAFVGLQDKIGNTDITTASSGINNTETIIAKTAALPSGRLVAGTMIKVKFHGQCTSTVANVSTFAIRIGTAGTTSDGLMASATTAAAATTGSSIDFYGEMTLTVRTTGSGATCYGELVLFNGGTTGISTVLSQVILPSFTTFNTTTRQELKINFSKCKLVDHSALIVLKIIITELIEDIKEFNKNLLYLPVNLKIKIIESKEKTVNSDLVIFNFLPIEETNWDKSGFQPIHTIYPLGFIKGSKAQKSYLENKKGTIVTHIVSYINQCLLNHDVSLDATEKNSIEGLVSEVLNNAEDHSPMSTYYINANFSQKSDESNSKTKVGQLNLSVMNFGYSIFEGFEETKENNKVMYDEMEQIFNKVNSEYKHSFTKENLFTLYALQEGFSRLKYEDDSRGTGTMKFINSFFQIGDYEDPQNNLYPSLNLFSGSTQIYCNNTFKPFLKDNRFFISLNRTQDIFDLPDEKHLINLRKKFPGTVFSAKIYLNREHLINKINKDGNDKD